MELFRVSCVTCRARLSVRNRSAIGNIVACPKCGSMVQIVPPHDWVDEAQAEQSQIAVRVTESSLSESADPGVLDSSDQTPATIPNTAAESNAAEIRSSAALNESGPALDEMDASAFAPPAPTEQEPFVEAALDPAAKPADIGAATGLASYKLIAWAAAAAMGGGALLGGWLLWGSDDASPDPPSSAVAKQAHAGAQPTEVAANVDKPGSEQPPLPTADTTAKNDSQESADVDDASNADPEKEPPGLSQLPDPPQSVVASADDDASDAAVRTASKVPMPDAPSPSPVEAAESDASNGRETIDPLAIDPEGLDLSLLFGESEPGDAPLDQSAEAAQQDGDAAAIQPPADAEDHSARPSAVDVVRIDPAEHSAIDAVDAATVLERKFPRFEIDGMPLCRFLDFATQLSGLPVSVPPEQLRIAGVSLANNVDVDLRDVTFEEALDAALKPLRLTPRNGDMQVTLQCTREQGVREVTFPVDDLTSDEVAVEDVAQWLKQLTPAAAWTDRSATIAVQGDKIAVRQLESVQYDALVLLEKLRRAQGLSRRSKYPGALISSASPYVELAERMSGPATFTFSRYTPLRAIFRDWQEEMTVPVLVDWPALADAQLGPHTRIACSIADKPWSEALDAVLEPLGLAWRAIDGPAVQITTMTKHLSDPQTQIYRLAGGGAVDVAQAATYAAEFAADLASTAAGDAAVIAHPDKPLLLVRQPAVVHRELVRWLSEREELPPQRNEE